MSSSTLDSLTLSSTPHLDEHSPLLFYCIFPLASHPIFIRTCLFLSLLSHAPTPTRILERVAAGRELIFAVIRYGKRETESLQRWREHNIRIFDDVFPVLLVDDSPVCPVNTRYLTAAKKISIACNWTTLESQSSIADTAFPDRLALHVPDSQALRTPRAFCPKIIGSAPPLSLRDGPSPLLLPSSIWNCIISCGDEPTTTAPDVERSETPAGEGFETGTRASEGAELS